MAERLVVLAPNWLGDVVMAQPALAAIRGASPDAHLVVAARASVAGVLAFVEGVDEVLALPPGSSVGAQARLLAGQRCDRAVLLPNSFHAAWMAWRAGIRRRAGFCGDGRAWLLTERVRRPAGRVRHVEYYLALTTALGFEAGSSVPRLRLTADARAEADALLQAEGIEPGAPIVVLAPGAAGGPAKQWRPEHAARVIEDLAARDGVRVVIVGAPADREVADRVLGPVSGHTRGCVVDLVGRTSLGGLAGVLARAQVVVANDSGALHLAAAFGTPVVALFGATDERVTAPSAADPSRATVLTHTVWCRPCGLRACPIDHACMKGITPVRVMSAVEAWL